MLSCCSCLRGNATEHHANPSPSQTEKSRLDDDSLGEIDSQSKRKNEFILVTEDAKKADEFSAELFCMGCVPTNDHMKNLKFYEVDDSGNIALSTAYQLDQIYLFHPHDETECIPVNYHREIIAHLKNTELKTLLLRLGAEEVSHHSNHEISKEKVFGADLGVVAAAVTVGAELEYRKSSNISRGEANAFKISEPNTEYLLRVPDSDNEIMFDKSRIGKNLKFFSDPQWQNIIELRTNNWTERESLSNHFNESKFYKMAAKLTVGFVSAGGNFENNPGFETSLEYSVKFFPKEHFTGDLYEKLEWSYDTDIKRYGEIVKIGRVFVQNNNIKQWDERKIVLRKKGIILSNLDDTNRSQEWYPINRDRLAQDLEILPDDGRSSRHSAMFPLSIPINDYDEDDENNKEKKLILATDTGREMWCWASLIRWLYDGKPNENLMPEFYSPNVTDSHSKWYEDERALQNILLEIVTYTNFPKSALSYSDVMKAASHEARTLKGLVNDINRVNEYKGKWTFAMLRNSLNEVLIDLTEEQDDASIGENDSSTEVNNSSAVEDNPQEVQLEVTEPNEKKELYQLPSWTQEYQEDNVDLQEFQDLLSKIVVLLENDREDYISYYEGKLKEALTEETANCDPQYCLPEWVKEYDADNDDLSSLEKGLVEIKKRGDLDYVTQTEGQLERILNPVITPTRIANEIGFFAFKVIKGSCIQVKEKCFELILSTYLYDFKSEPNRIGNSPISLACEGNYDETRKHIIARIFQEGKSIRDDKAGGDYAFVRMISKPQTIGGIRSIIGRPVHKDDQDLCFDLIKRGDCSAGNKALQSALIKSIEEESKEFIYNGDMATKLIIPKNYSSFMAWGSHTLTKLDLSDMSIIEIPDEIYDFVNLTYLSFDGNCLFKISQMIRKLTELKVLKLVDNLIEELPSSLEYLEQITEFNCDGNPITKPPEEIWSKGINNVQRYFRDSRVRGTRKNSDVRVLVLGLSEAGKTSLINGLLISDETNDNGKNNKGALTRKGHRTVGIERTLWKVDRGEKKGPANLIVFDFAGQEEYYVTHHIFLSKRSLYVLAFDLSKYRAGMTNAGLLERQISVWWDGIENRVCDTKKPSSTPKVILVGTHADMFNNYEAADGEAARIYGALSKRFENRDNKFKKQIDHFYNQLKLIPPNSEKSRIMEKQIHELSQMRKVFIDLPTSIIPMSSLDMHNMDKVKQIITDSLTEEGQNGKYFPELDEELPLPYFEIRSFIREQVTKSAIQKPMDVDSYYKLIKENLDIDMETAKDATEFCHNLGDILFYENIGVVFLQPKFLIDAFKAVIRHDHREATRYALYDEYGTNDLFDAAKDNLLNCGKLEEWFLSMLWSRLGIEKGYEKSNIYGKMIDLLAKFDVAYVAEWEQGEFLESKPKILIVPEFQTPTLEQSSDKKWPMKEKEECQYEVQRWICLDDKELPRDLLKRLQVRLFTSNIFVSLLNFLSQEQIVIFDSKGVEVFITTHGTEDHHFSHGDIKNGLRLHVRCKDKEVMWSLFSRIDKIIKSLFKDWSGLTFKHFAVHTSEKGDFVLTSVLKLEELRKSGEKYTVVAGGNNRIVTTPYTEIVTIEDLLGLEGRILQNQTGVTNEVDDFITNPLFETLKGSLSNMMGNENHDNRTKKMLTNARLSRNVISSKTEFDQNLRILFKEEIDISPEDVNAMADVFYKCAIKNTNDLFDFVEDGESGIANALGDHTNDIAFANRKRITRWLKQVRETS